VARSRRRSVAWLAQAAGALFVVFMGAERHPPGIGDPQ
jgi:hypothetical protein